MTRKTITKINVPVAGPCEFYFNRSDGPYTFAVFPKGSLQRQRLMIIEDQIRQFNDNTTKKD